MPRKPCNTVKNRQCCDVLVQWAWKSLNELRPPAHAAAHAAAHNLPWWWATEELGAWLSIRQRVLKSYRAVIAAQKLERWTYASSTCLPHSWLPSSTETWHIPQKRTTAAVDKASGTIGLLYECSVQLRACVTRIPMATCGVSQTVWVAPRVCHCTTPLRLSSQAIASMPASRSERLPCPVHAVHCQCERIRLHSAVPLAGPSAFVQVAHLCAQWHYQNMDTCKP